MAAPAGSAAGSEPAAAAGAPTPPIAACSIDASDRGPMMRSIDKPSPTADDRDGDGLSDELEARLCTRPDHKDTDGDGLLDGWEVRGVNNLALYQKGADPRRIDIFVFMDHMKYETPSPSVLKQIEAVFGSAPVLNHDGSSGIRLHLELAPAAVPSQSFVDKLVPAYFAIKHRPFGPFRPDWIPVYRYMIWAKQFSRQYDSGWAMEGIGGPDFLVALDSRGKDHEKVGTFIHELGHTLGLRHGGIGPNGKGSDANFGPNHLSVMNHRYQMSGVMRGGRREFTYQDVDTIALREDRLDESAGLGRAARLADYVTHWHPVHSAIAGQGINWNGNGAPDEPSVVVDLDGERGTTSWPAVTNEWRHLDYSARRTIGNHGDPEGLERELVDRAHREAAALGKIKASNKLKRTFAKAELSLDAARLDAALQQLAAEVDLVESFAGKLE